MPRRATGDYERVEQALEEEEIREEIKAEYGGYFEDLSARDQRQALLDVFFRSEPYYLQSAEDMREGLRYSKETGISLVRVDSIKVRGKEHRIIRDSKTGRIRQWVKE
jgi:hypothetical protein